VSENEITCECGHKFSLEFHPDDKIARCPKCGLRIRVQDSDKIEDFLLVHGVLHHIGHSEDALSGSLVVTLDSISFIGPTKLHPIHLQDRKEVLPSGFKKRLTLAVSIITLAGTIPFWGVVFAHGWSDNLGFWLAILILGVITAAAFIQLTALILGKPRKQRPEEAQAAPPFMLDMDEVDRFADFHKGMRSLHEQIVESLDMEKKIRQLAKYRPGSIRMARKRIGSVTFDGSSLVILGMKRKLTFAIPPQQSDKLRGILRGYDYMS
jgi:hypothetical protein